MSTPEDAEGLAAALSGLVGAVGSLRWWFGQVSESHPARDRVPDCNATLDEVARSLRSLSDDLDALPRP